MVHTLKQVSTEMAHALCKLGLHGFSRKEDIHDNLVVTL